MAELSENTLVVFVSDSHIGGDRGCDGFESPDELEVLFVELADREGPVELILTGDFFDFLQIGKVADGENRASLTIDRPEYRDLFAALKRFREAADKRVTYLPGNHDAESFWNKEIQKTLRERGLVDELPYYYLASVETGGGRRVVYCEHGNQFDPENRVGDYHDPLDTPLGHHVVMPQALRAVRGDISWPGPLGDKDGLPVGGDTGLDREPIFLQSGGKGRFLPPRAAARGVRFLQGGCVRDLPRDRR